ncbi:MAG TPA: hypothetical protein VFN56_05105 [Candidatus Saccharimonadales bacterium]|nr:hypothetical protein [Candidatus Saccharimonadales bacterium]
MDLTKLYILSLLAGMVAAYAVPLFVNGISGREQRSPFGMHTALVSVVSGWVLMVVSVLLLHFAHPWAHAYRTAVLFAVGVLVVAAYLANWSMSRTKK